MDNPFMLFPKFRDEEYLRADKVSGIDRFLEKTCLWTLPHWMTPNHITLFRMIATPFTILLLVDRHYAFGIPLFLFVAFTDALDGALARTKNQITVWGMMFDPVADKLLIISAVAVFMFSALNSVIAGGIIVSEILIIILALLWRRAGNVVKANVWGKIKMILQVIGVFLLLLAVQFSSPILLTFATVVLAGSILCGIVSIFTHGI